MPPSPETPRTEPKTADRLEICVRYFLDRLSAEELAEFGLCLEHGIAKGICSEKPWFKKIEPLFTEGTALFSPIDKIIGEQVIARLGKKN